MRMFKRILIGGIIGDLIPNTFSFSAITGAALNTAILSGPITISGINGPTPVSCTGGVNVSINGGAYVSSGTITNGQTIQAKLTSSNAYTTLVTGNVNIGGVIAAFNVTTSAQPRYTVVLPISKARGSWRRTTDRVRQQLLALLS